MACLIIKLSLFTISEIDDKKEGDSKSPNEFAEVHDSESDHSEDSPDRV